MASKIGVTAVSVSKWELDENTPKGKHLFSLANALQTEPEWLLTGNDRPIENKAYELCAYFNDLDIIDSDKCLCKQATQLTTVIPSYVFDRIGAEPSDIYCINVTGNSMEPTLNHGSVIAVDCRVKRIHDGSIYVFRQEGMLRIKQLYQYPEYVILHSYNPLFEPEKSELSKIDVIGKVVWASVFFDV
ncbi:DNA-binding protein RDGA [Shewanella sairae]|uniref:DNA-binding protein RDGA n=1 Tax=Shewanella sairae TaxID=190310 RepID=A0ABQ4PRR2_9GAMM|nr:DNA-binding protein RDGA [Shewanella sairae]